MIKIHAIAIVFFAMCSLVACNTWDGIKQDSNEVGDAVGEAADNVKEAIHEATE